MKITDGEKLILLMLSELYESLKVDGEINPKFIKEAIFSNNLWALPWKYPGIPFEDQEDPAIIREVLDILEMWSSIEYSYSQLDVKQKNLLENEASPFGKNPKFSGFDGNRESDYMGTASFIVNELGRFEEFQGRSFNSHLPSIEVYRRMLTVFNAISHANGFNPLSVNDLVSILKEKAHPDNR